MATSAIKKRTCPPESASAAARSQSATVACPASAFTSAIVTAAPSRANAMAVARPIPNAPPVMTTHFPLKFPRAAGVLIVPSFTESRSKRTTPPIVADSRDYLESATRVQFGRDFGQTISGCSPARLPQPEGDEGQLGKLC